MNLIMGLVGMATLILIAVLFSSNRKAIKIRTVGGAFAIQAGLGANSTSKCNSRLKIRLLSEVRQKPPVAV